MKLIIYFILILIHVGCTDTSKTSLPDKKKYEDDGTLMVNICKKFSEEPDPKKLNTAAVAVQAARVVSCANYNEECNIYGRCLTEVIQASKDGNISSSERSDIKKIATELKAAVTEGISKLEAKAKENP